jgi:DNA-binding response OmpR family regulator
MSSEAPRILLVDDEHSVQTLLTYPLRKEGYEVIAASTGQEALDRFREGDFDLVVLDVMLPEVDGFDVCRQLRARSSVPIIMLTAKAEELDKVLGLELGADDYITKPFSMREFRSRVRAALRRAEMSQLDGDDEPLDRVWGDSAFRDQRTVDVHIRHLREKVERDPKNPEHLLTVRGVGYRFRDE